MQITQKKIIVAVTGGIAAYKACSLVNTLIAKGATVRVVMTENAKKFVSPLTFQSLTNHPVYDDLWQQVSADSVEHIALSHWPDVIIVAPATANTIGKMASGLADNLLTTIVLARLPTVEIVIVPAMNKYMWDNKLVQKNIQLLKDEESFRFVEPRSGILACRDEGKGKIADTEEIIKMIESLT